MSLLFLWSCSYSTIYKFLYSNIDALVIREIEKWTSLDRKQKKIIKDEIKVLKGKFENVFARELIEFAERIKKNNKFDIKSDEEAQKIFIDFRYLRQRAILVSTPSIAQFFLILNAEQRENLYKKWQGRSDNETEGEGSATQSNEQETAINNEDPLILEREFIAATIKAWAKNSKYAIGKLNPQQERIISKIAKLQFRNQQVVREYNQRRLKTFITGVQLRIANRPDQLAEFLNYWFLNPYKSGNLKINQKMREIDQRRWKALKEIYLAMDSKQSNFFDQRIDGFIKFLVSVIDQAE